MHFLPISTHYTYAPLLHLHVGEKTFGKEPPCGARWALQRRLNEELPDDEA